MIQAKMKMGRIMQLAAFSLAEVTYATGDISYLVQEAATQATFQVAAKSENVSGVMLPAFDVVRKRPGDGSGGNDFTLTGLGRGGQQVQKSRETYAKAVETLVELASLQVSSITLPAKDWCHCSTASFRLADRLCDP
jgi:V-type H+-transporting ATPase subunit D